MAQIDILGPNDFLNLISHAYLHFITIARVSLKSASALGNYSIMQPTLSHMQNSWEVQFARMKNNLATCDNEKPPTRSTFREFQKDDFVKLKRPLVTNGRRFPEGTIAVIVEILEHGRLINARISNDFDTTIIVAAYDLEISS